LFCFYAQLKNQTTLAPFLWHFASAKNATTTINQCGLVASIVVVAHHKQLLFVL